MKDGAGTARIQRRRFELRRNSVLNGTAWLRRSGLRCAATLLAARGNDASCSSTPITFG